MDKELSFYLAKGTYINYSLGCEDGRAEGSTKLKADPAIPIPEGTENKLQWLYANGKLTKHTKNMMDQLRLTVNKHLQECQAGNKPVYASDIDNIVAREMRKKQSIKRSSKLIDMFTRYYEAVDKDEIINERENKPYGRSSKILRLAVKDELAKCSIAGNDISRVNADDIATFKKHLIKQGHTQNTIAAYNNMLLTFFAYTFNKWHKNPLHTEKGLRAKAEDIDHAIYYTMDEIALLYNMKLPRRLVQPRDIFVYGCLTCLRHVDLSHPERQNIQDGYLVLNTQKTGESVTIPLHPIAKEILAKYKGHIPVIVRQSLSTSIRKVCKMAGFDNLCLFVRTEGGVVKRQFIERYNMTSTHTMRRSFATNAILAGVPETWIMRIGGWRSHSSFKKYMRMSNMDIAKQAAKLPFFGGG